MSEQSSLLNFPFQPIPNPNQQYRKQQVHRYSYTDESTSIPYTGIFLNDPDFVSFKLLKDLEDERYQLNQLVHKTPWEIFLYQMKHASLKIVIYDYLFWFSILVYTFTRYISILIPKWTFQSHINYTPMSTIGTMMSFVIVFFVSQCYTRFCQQYDASVAIKGKIIDIMLHVRQIISETEQWRLWRYLNAAHILAYTGLSDVYNERNLFLPLIRKYQLLTELEYAILCTRRDDIDRNGDSCSYLEPITWATDGIFAQYNQNLIKSHDVYPLLNNIQILRSKFSLLSDTKANPIPFSYMFIVVIVEYIYLPLFAYYCAQSLPAYETTSWSQEIMGYTCVFLFCIFVIGLIGLARRMQDPYGLDRENVRIVHIVLETLEESMKLVHGSSSNSSNTSRSDKHSISSKSEFPIDTDSQNSCRRNKHSGINNTDDNSYCSKTFASSETEAKLDKFRKGQKC